MINNFLKEDVANAVTCDNSNLMSNHFSYCLLPMKSIVHSV